jgi:hypothetical protein
MLVIIYTHQQMHVIQLYKLYINLNTPTCFGDKSSSYEM